MQILKKNIEERILFVANQEFKKNGFIDTSIRTIAQKAGVSISNIYNYFKNKEELFLKILAPLLNELEALMSEHNKPENINLNFFYSQAIQQETFEMYSRLILNYKEELNLLLFKSYGSSLENFRDEYTDRHTKTGMEYLQKMKEKYPDIETNISEFFMHTVISWWFSIIGEIVSHGLNEKEIKSFIAQYIEFSTAGWKKIMKVK